MILIITHKEDYTADYLVNILNERKIPYKRFNCEDILKTPFSVDFQSDYLLDILGENTYYSVWFRRVKLPDFPGIKTHEHFYLQRESEAFLKSLFSVIEAKWLSNPFSVYQAEHKLLQIKIAKKLGLKTPKTLVTNSKLKLQEFFKACDGDIIVKPIGQTRISSTYGTEFIYTSIVTKEFITNIDDYDLTPCIFQEHIIKASEIRVTVVGDKVFAAEVDSQIDPATRIDWRRKNIKFSTCELPDEINNLCVKLVKELSLNFGAIDLIKTPEEDYIFLEINPNGQWAWIELETGLPISNAIITFLSDEKNS
ncbi:hypothetical protein [Flavobacterium subsaxonicum]|uniref:hypothetical protein n=1 Tax=Flavobacterium subsaxonicum TaxID=426226 RepID=UPI000406112E|nr:hypothetical protein [Flavobacterium subsaxonicum]